MQCTEEDRAAGVAISDDDMMNRPIPIGEIRSVLTTRIDDISEQQIVINGERDLVIGDPLTKPQAQRLAASDYVMGEDRMLDKQENELKIKRDQLSQDEKSIIAYGKEHGLDKTIWRKAPEVFKGEGLKYYESTIAAIEHNNKVFDRQSAEIQNKRGQLEERLQTPEARLMIAKRSEEYLARDRERLAERARLDSKLNELKKEKSDVVELRNALPSRQLKDELNIKGNAKEVQNLLGQTDQIKQQVSAMLLTVSRTSGPSHSLQISIK